MTANVIGSANTVPAPNAITVGLTGDSIAQYNNSSISDYINLAGGTAPAQGWFHWANAILGNRLHLVSSTGIGSQGIATIAARFTANMLSLSPLPDIIIIQGGINDLWRLAGPPTGVNVANQIITLANQVLAVGKIPIIMGITPFPGSDVPNANAALRSYVAATPALLCDVYPLLTDPNTGAYYTQYSDGGTPALHPNVSGAQVIGAALANLIAAVSVKHDQLALTNSDTNSMTTNPTLTGTGGTFFGSGSGQVATGWQSSSGGADVVWSKVARADGIGSWQQMAFTGVAAETATLFQSSQTTGAVMTAGHAYAVACEIQGDLWNQCASVLLTLNIQGASGQLTYAQMGGANDAGGMYYTTPTGTIVFASPAVIAPAGISYFITQLAATMVTGNIRVGRMTMYEITPRYPFTRL